MESTIFCPGCFADEESGSWDHIVFRTDRGGYCTNCGNSVCVELPKLAVASIRAQASWVGKRYYPNDEDRENYAERNALLALVVEFPGRVATPAEKPGWWEVRQDMPNGRYVSTMVTGPDAESAMRKSGLTYYTAEQLKPATPQAAEGEGS